MVRTQGMILRLQEARKEYKKFRKMYKNYLRIGSYKPNPERQCLAISQDYLWDGKNTQTSRNMIERLNHQNTCYIKLGIGKARLPPMGAPDNQHDTNMDLAIVDEDLSDN